VKILCYPLVKSEAWEGGALFDLKGSFVGMNLFSSKERTLFLPTSIIFGRLVHFQLSLRSKFLAQLKNLKAGSVEKVLTKRDGADLSRTSKNDERTDDLTRLKDNITDDPTISSNMNKRTDDIANSWKKNKRTCYGGGKKLN